MFLNSSLKKTIFLCGDLNQKNSAEAVRRLRPFWPQHHFVFITTDPFEDNAKIDIFKYSEDSSIETTISTTFPEFLRLLCEEICDKINHSPPNNFIIDFNTVFMFLPKWFSNEAMENGDQKSVELLNNILVNTQGKKYFSENCARTADGHDPIYAINYDNLQLFDELILRLASDRNNSLQAFKNIFQLSARVLS